MSVANRERWLLRAVDLFARRLFKHHDVTLPEVKVSVGFPGGRGSKRHIGQHWAPEASDDKKGSIFIHPIIDDSEEVLAILVHELVHAAVGNKHGHGPVFRKLALKVGLEGPMRESVAGPELQVKLKAWVKQLGEYPHAKLNLDMGPIKKQTTRMIKMECGECGYIARASRKLIEHLGPVLCPCNSEPMNVEGSEGDE